MTHPPTIYVLALILPTKPCLYTGIKLLNLLLHWNISWESVLKVQIWIMTTDSSGIFSEMRHFEMWFWIKTLDCEFFLLLPLPGCLSPAPVVSFHKCDILKYNFGLTRRQHYFSFKTLWVFSFAPPPSQGAWVQPQWQRVPSHSGLTITLLPQRGITNTKYTRQEKNTKNLVYYCQ